MHLHFGRMAVDATFGGMALSHDERDRLADMIGEKPVLLMGHHGAFVVGPTITQTFDALCYCERACETLITTHQTGRPPLRIADDNVAKLTPGNGRKIPHLAEDY